MMQSSKTTLGLEPLRGQFLWPRPQVQCLGLEGPGLGLESCINTFFASPLNQRAAQGQLVLPIPPHPHKFIPIPTPSNPSPSKFPKRNIQQSLMFAVHFSPKSKCSHYSVFQYVNKQRSIDTVWMQLTSPLLHCATSMCIPEAQALSWFRDQIYTINMALVVS